MSLWLAAGAGGLVALVVGLCSRTRLAAFRFWLIEPAPAWMICLEVGLFWTGTAFIHPTLAPLVPLWVAGAAVIY